ncbi:MAG: hypothetical protein HKN27_03820 [Silicimonas sp.]|nr:hypothetical protein [Silicimonas sp.]
MSDTLVALWADIEPAKEFILSVLVTLLTTFLLWLFRARVNLTYGSASTNFHSFRLSPEGEQISVWTEKFYFQNIGRKPAREVEIVFNMIPTSYNMFPTRDHQVSQLGNGFFSIKVPSIAPNELVVIDIIDIGGRELNLQSVNCPDAIANEVKFLPTRQYGKLFEALVCYLLIAGFFASVYFVLQLTVGS